MKYLSFLGTVCLLSLSPALTYASFEDEQKDESFTSMNKKTPEEMPIQEKKLSRDQKQAKKHRPREGTIDKENIPPQKGISDQKETRAPSLKEESKHTSHKLLSQRVAEIRFQAQEGFKEASVEKIYQAFKDFELVKGNKKWKALGTGLGLHKSPSQKSWKETIGADIFRPTDIHTWEDHYSDQYKFRRRDTLWRLAIGARYNDPVSKLYLAKGLWGIQTDCHEDVDRFPNIIWELFDEAFEDLKTQQEFPVPYYLLWRSTRAPLYRTVDIDKKEIFAFAERGDLRSRYEVLEEKNCNKRDYPTRPSAKDYYDLGEQGFLSAYVKAAKLEKDFDKKIETLQRAVEKEYRPALLNLGSRYYDREKDEEARKYFKEAGKQGIAEGYVELGITYVGDDEFLEDLGNVKSLTEEDIRKGIKYFMRAGEAYHPEGWEGLIRLNRALARTKEDVEEASALMERAFEAVTRGMALGSLCAYGAGEKYFSKRSFEEVWKDLIRRHGPSFEDPAFCHRIEAFVREKGDL